MSRRNSEYFTRATAGVELLRPVGGPGLNTALLSIPEFEVHPVPLNPQWVTVT